MATTGGKVTNTDSGSQDDTESDFILHDCHFRENRGVCPIMILSQIFVFNDDNHVF